ncbi:MAG: chemotaxis response regulator protein-glutamate methylesterase [Desulfobulbaceae bacterium]|nr:chemotaxis response regulator protein-glutamate methylesterase [Desulfobulbaceae bacterium]
MRIAIANNRNQTVEILRRIILSVPGNEIAWIARSGSEAVDMCFRDGPDLILMELLMPGLDGVEATQRIMEKSPCPILMVTSSVDGNTAGIFRAMGYGALDVINTPVAGTGDDARESSVALLKKISNIGRLKRKPPLNKERHGVLPVLLHIPPLIVIGSSTGGPKALAELLAGLPGTLPAGVVIVQHVDGEFSLSLANWLDAQTSLKVLLASHGRKPLPATVFLAGSNDHLIVTKELALVYTAEPKGLAYRPSVDLFFESVARHWPEKGVAVLLTGMGRDGARGLAALRNAGWYTIAQDEATSVVYGMPKAAKELGAAVDILPLSVIAPAILDFFRKKSEAVFPPFNRSINPL